MIDDLTGLLVTLGVVLGPIWLVMHYKYKNRSFGQMTGQDAAAFEQIAATAQRLEQRVATLERILDTEIPAWRGNNGSGPAPDGFYNRQAG